MIGCANVAFNRGFCKSHYFKDLYARNPENFRKKRRFYRETHPDKVRQTYKKWRSANLDKDRERSREYGRKLYAENPDKVKELARMQKHRRRALKMRASGKFTVADWRSLVARSPHCYWCKQPWKNVGKPTHDHVIPLSKGGANSPENSVCACRSCNTKKQATRFDPISGQGILL